jgi:hypothetical protein
LEITKLLSNEGMGKGEGNFSLKFPDEELSFNFESRIEEGVENKLKLVSEPPIEELIKFLEN